MTVGELKQMLEGLDDDAEVRVAHEPSWPFEYDIARVVAVQPDDDAANPVHRAIDDEGNCATVIYLVEGCQLGYLPEQVAIEIGWK